MKRRSVKVAAVLFVTTIVFMLPNVSTFAQNQGRVGFSAVTPETANDPTQIRCKAGTQWYVVEIAATGFEFNSNGEAQTITEEILKAAGYLPETIIARAALVDNAAACSSLGTNYILYNPKWFKQIYLDTEERWADRGIFAHELGHFHHNHYLRGLSSIPPLELEADEYAGEILAKLGATLKQAKAAFESSRMRSEGSHSHPPTKDRLVAIEKGWKKINRISNTDPTRSTNLQKVRTYLDQGKRFENEKQFEKAIQEYTKAIDLEPNFAEAYKNRGWGYYKQNKFALAVADYSKAIEKDPLYASAYNLRGVAYRRLSEYELALADFNKVITLDPNHIIVYNNRGNIYDDLDELASALADYSKVVELDPKFVDGYHNLGNIYERLGKLELALQNYTKAIELDPKYHYAYRNRSGVYRKLGKIELAEADEKMEIKLKKEQNR